MSIHQTYKEALQTALKCLEEAEGHALSGVLNIAFAGEYKELGRLYGEGEMFELTPQHLRIPATPTLILF